MANIVLVGFMGSGKTTIGRLLADFIHCPHLDLDHIITEDSGQSINQIFAEQGEKYFRELESKTLVSALCRDGILSTGGGTLISPINRRVLNQSGIPIIFLKTSPKVILERLQGDQTRPLARALDENKLIALYQKRDRYYERSADIKIITDQKAPLEIVHEIIEKIGIYFLSRINIAGK